MTPQQAGKIASKSIGILLIIVGVVTLVEYFYLVQQANSLTEESGLSNYEPMIEEVSESLVTHDSYYVSSSVLSFLSPYLFIGLGIVFLILAGPIGKLIAGKTEDEE